MFGLGSGAEKRKEIGGSMLVLGDAAGKTRYRVWPIIGKLAAGSDDKAEAEKYARLHGMKMVEWLNHPAARAYYKAHQTEEIAYVQKHQNKFVGTTFLEKTDIRKRLAEGR